MPTTSRATAAIDQPTPEAATRAERNGILLVTELFPPAIGGSAELFANIYRRVRDVEVDVLSDIQASNWGVMSPSALRHHVAVAGTIRRRSRDISVVHCGRLLPEGLPAMLARAAGGRPYVCWTHGEELAYISSSRELKFLLRQVQRNAAAVVANSHNTAAMLQRLGVPREKCRVVHPGVDATRFRPYVTGAPALRARYANHGEVLLLSVGRLQRRKGHDLVIQALSELKYSWPPVKYVIVGDGDERERLMQLVRGARLDDMVTFVGSVESAELPAYYAAADIFVHPNRVEAGDFEGFGIVFLEAAAAGLPAIGGKSGGVPEAVVDGVTGVLVSGTDAGELRRAIVDLAYSRQRDEMGRAARARAMQEFSWERAAERVRALHDELSPRC